MKITLLADIMCEPPVLKAAKRRGDTYDFRGVFLHAKGLLEESDYVIGNLETPLAGKLKKLFCMTSTYSRHDDRTEGEIDDEN